MLLSLFNLPHKFSFPSPFVFFLSSTFCRTSCQKGMGVRVLICFWIKVENHKEAILHLLCYMFCNSFNKDMPSLSNTSKKAESCDSAPSHTWTTVQSSEVHSCWLWWKSNVYSQDKCLATSADTVSHSPCVSHLYYDLKLETWFSPPKNKSACLVSITGSGLMIVEAKVCWISFHCNFKVEVI